MDFTLFPEKSWSWQSDILYEIGAGDMFMVLRVHTFGFPRSLYSFQTWTYNTVRWSWHLSLGSIPWHFGKVDIISICKIMQNPTLLVKLHGRSSKEQAFGCWVKWHLLFFINLHCSQFLANLNSSFQLSSKEKDPVTEKSTQFLRRCVLFASSFVSLS